MKRFGIIASRGGAAFAAAERILTTLGASPFVASIVDRPCGFQEEAARAGLPCRLVPWRDTVSFSAEALAHFRGHEVDAVLLFYTRRVGTPLVGGTTVLNIHPSLLPAFPGMGAARATLASGARICGATLHAVDEGLDTGPIIAQVSSPLPLAADLAVVNRIGYAHKVYLTLLAAALGRLDMVGHPERLCRLPVSPSAAPALPERTWSEAYMTWLQTDCPEVVFRA